MAANSLSVYKVDIPRGDGMSPRDMEFIAKRVYELMNPGAKPENNLPENEVPFEDIELVGEEVNRKIALNQKIFYRYSGRAQDQEDMQEAYGRR